MAVSAVLVESTPYLLKYLVTATSGSTASPTTDTQTTIPNDGGATPDLRTDSLAAVSGGAFNANGPYNILRIARARIDGYGPIAAGALTQAQARALLASDDAANAVLTNRNIMSCEMFMTARSRPLAGSTVATRPSWFCDANVDASGDPVVTVGITHRPTLTITGYLTIRLRNSVDL